MRSTQKILKKDFFDKLRQTVEAAPSAFLRLHEPVPGVLFPFFPAGVAGQRPEDGAGVGPGEGDILVAGV